MKILVAVDGSPFTKRMLAYLAAHDEWLGPHHDYTVIHAVPAVPPRAAAVFDKETLQGHYDEEGQKVFEPIRAFFAQQKMRGEFVLKVGPAADAIAEAANQGKFDLLVLGSHGHGTLTNLVMGSVATKVLAHCGTPALLIR
jgi:nucleotide-binding universal stress UspA family protein